MKKRFVPSQSWLEAIEEERKAKTNLSRLMNTFKHVPSNRLGDSLSILVSEIECFNPAEHSKEVRSSNRSLNPNLLIDHRAVNLQGRRKTAQPLQSNESNKQIEFTSVFPKPKKAATLTTEAKLIERRKLSSKNETNSSTVSKPIQINKPKHNHLAGINSERNYYNLDNKIPKNKLQKDSTNKQRKFDLSHKPETKQRSNEETKVAVNNRQALNKTSNQPINKNLNVLNKAVSNSKKSNVGQKPLFGGGVVKYTGRLKNTTLPSIAPNQVKKLTTYWNNVLNNEMDQLQSEISSSRSSIKSCKSRECLSEETPSSSNLNIKSRSMSEVDLSTLTKIDQVSSDCTTNTKSEYKRNRWITYKAEQRDAKTRDTRTDHINYPTNTSLSTTTTSISTEPNKNVEQECETGNKILNEIQQSRSHIEFVVSTNQALKTLERLLRYIKVFPSSSLLSDEIRLPRSVKVMISLLTATLSSDQYEQLWIEVSEFELTHSKRTNSNENIRMVSPLLSEHGGMGDGCSPQNDHAGVLVLPNKNSIQVSNALKFISLCKEVLWTMYITNPHSWQNHQTGTFSFVYEHTILVEETDSDCSEEDYEEREEEEEASIRDLLHAATNTLGEFANWGLQSLRDNWPNSMESIIKTIYYTIVSALVWWVIFKEIWYAK